MLSAPTRSADGGYQAIRWSNSNSGSGRGTRSQSGAGSGASCQAGGPRAGEIGGGCGGSPSAKRIYSTGAASVRNAALGLASATFHNPAIAAPSTNVASGKSADFGRCVGRASGSERGRRSAVSQDQPLSQVAPAAGRNREAVTDHWAERVKIRPESNDRRSMRD